MSYDLILADPETRFETWAESGEGKSPQAHYDTMTWDELAALPVSQLARGDAILFLWACWPTIRESLNLMEQWGFEAGKFDLGEAA
jgi:N6-adenosine-specific RNA methylase IME4